MPLVMTSAPAAEPVTVTDAKAHLRIDHDAENALLASLILTSRLHIETALGIALVAQGWRLLLDRWPTDGVVEIPLRPILSVGAIRVRGSDGAPALVASTDYAVDAASLVARIVPAGAWPSPGVRTHGIEIDMTAGFGTAAGDVPEPIRRALLLLTAHWYEHRDPIEIGSDQTVIPAAVSDLVSPWRRKRL